MGVGPHAQLIERPPRKQERKKTMDAREDYPPPPEGDGPAMDVESASDETTAEHGSTEESSALPASGESASDWRSRLWKSSRTAWNWD